jgi:hypothetical protein
MLDLFRKNTDELNKQGWEQTRFISYIAAQVQSTKKIKPTDILQLPWDNLNNKNKKTQLINNIEKKRLIEEMKKIEKIL